MKAMVLAAGLGTRLRPLTNNRPKALVDLAGRTPLEITLSRLREFGVRDVIINAHHFADMIVEYLEAHQNFGMRIEISREPHLLDTGGGLKKAADFFLKGEPSMEKPFILHNVDVISSVDLGRMLKFHTEHRALATLAVQERPTSRYLLFDDAGQLCGRKSGKDGTAEVVRPSPHLQPLAFCGIHVISTRFLTMMREEGAFSIIETYLRLAGEDEIILGLRADEYYWCDLGTAEKVAQAAEDLRGGRISV